MSQSLTSLIECGTKLWLDSIDPDLVQANRAWGATGATSNPIIIADLIKSGRFDESLKKFVEQGLDVHETTWSMTDQLVSEAEKVFLDIWENTSGNDGYVSFELDPLLEDPDLEIGHEEKVRRYLELGRRWSEGHPNRMIKVPATEAGIACLEDLVAEGVPVNVTLIFSERQYREARNAVWKGAQRRGSFSKFKSVYSIFVSRIDVYTQTHCPSLSPRSQGSVGIVNAQRIWAGNQEFWPDKSLPLQQEIIFASTGTKNPEDPAWKYVQALAGSDIQTNPPKTNEAVAESGLVFESRIEQIPDTQVLGEIYSTVDFAHLESTLMDEGIAKFASPQHELLELIGEKRQSLANA